MPEPSARLLMGTIKRGMSSPNAYDHRGVEIRTCAVTLRASAWVTRDRMLSALYRLGSFVKPVDCSWRAADSSQLSGAD